LLNVFNFFSPKFIAGAKALLSIASNNNMLTPATQQVITAIFIGLLESQRMEAASNYGSVSSPTPWPMR
jgi:hypothetical protein